LTVDCGEPARVIGDVSGTDPEPTTRRFLRARVLHPCKKKEEKVIRTLLFNFFFVGQVETETVTHPNSESMH
jgi:hypothetical protein